MNIGLGLSIFTYSYSEIAANGAIIWVYVAYVGVMTLIFVIVLPSLAHYTHIKGKTSRKKDPEEIELRSKEEEEMGEGEAYERPKLPKAPWVALGAFAGTTIVFLVVIITLIIL